MEIKSSALRILENIPLIGHLLALFYICMGHKNSAQRAAIKATLGIILAVLNLPAEIVDEARRKKPTLMYTYHLAARPQWMKSFKRRPLRHLCLPGSHQSATYEVHKCLRALPMLEGWSKCQKLDIKAQLVGGIRFLDLRLMSDGKSKEVWTHHNVVQCVRFRDVLQDVSHFVQQNPSEIVSLYLSNDGKDLDWSQVRGYINEFIGPPRIIPEYMSDMAIEDLTNYGRNVIFYGVPDVAFSWKCLDYRWPDKTNPDDLVEDMERSLQDLVLHNPYYLFWYKAECATNGAMITRDLGGLPGAIAAKKCPGKFAYMEELSAAANFKTQELLENVRSFPFNVYTTDYVADSMIERIIEMNFNEEAGAGPMPRSGSRSSSRPGSESTLNKSSSLSRSFALVSTTGTDQVPVDEGLGRMLSRSMNYITEESVFLDEEDSAACLNTSLLQVRETTC